MFRNRYYSVDRGSFVTRDPLGYVDGASMYLGYFGGNGVDPSGLITPDQYRNSIPWSRSGAGSDDYTMPGINPFIPSISGTDYLGGLAEQLGLSEPANHGSSQSLLTIVPTLGFSSYFEAIIAGRKISKDMYNSGKCKFKLLAHSQGVRNTLHAVRRYASKYCKKCGLCSKIVVRMVLIAPKVTESSVRASIKAIKKDCPKMDVRALVIYSSSDTVVPVGGSFFPFPGSYGRGQSNPNNNDVDGDGVNEIEEVLVPGRVRGNKLPTWLESHNQNVLLNEVANKTFFDSVKTFLNEAD